MNANILLSKISTARWDTATRTFGNDHATLIGLIVDWWVTLAPSQHSALESGPTNGYSRPGQRGQCDAMLCSAGKPVGVLEVEGNRKVETAQKLARFFDGKYPEIAGLQFGILLLYAYEPSGQGAARAFDPALSSDVVEEIVHATTRHQGKAILLVSIEKDYKRLHVGIRAKNEYYMGTPSLIEARGFVDGKKVGHRVLFSR